MDKINPNDVAAVTKAKIGAEIVKGTLDVLNSGQFTSGKKTKLSGVSDTLKESTDFQKKILNAAYNDKGSIFSTKD